MRFLGRLGVAPRRAKALASPSLRPISSSVSLIAACRRSGRSGAKEHAGDAERKTRLTQLITSLTGASSCSEDRLRHAADRQCLRGR